MYKKGFIWRFNIILSSTGGSLVERAKAKVREIFSTHTPSTIEEDVRREMNQILRNCKKDMLG